MYILIVARGYPTPKYKMHGIFEFDQAKALAKAGHKVIFAAVDVRSIRRWRKWGIEHKNIDGVEIYAINIPGGRIPKDILQMMSTTGLSILYKKILREKGKPDIMHAHFSSMGYTASNLKNKVDLPLIITEHLSTMMKPTINKRLFRIAGYAYENADALIAVSPELKKIIKKRFGKDAIYIPNIVDTELFNYVPTDNNGIFRFVSVGGLIVRKRMDMIIKAFVKAFNNNEKVTLTIFGEGPERKKIEDLISRCKASDRVTLMGMQSRKDISKYLKKCNCFVLASQAETFGVVYIEALASGLPVIASRCGGPESFINEENGVFVSVDDVDGLEKAMKYMYSNIDIFDQKSIATRTELLFSSEPVANMITKVYRDVLSSYHH